MKFILSVFSFFARYLIPQPSVNHTQTKEIIIKKDTEIRLLEEKIIHLQQEIQYKDTHIQELTRSNTTLEGKISKVLLDISTSIHLN